MAISKVADRATVNSNSGVTTADFVLSGLTVGNILIIRTAAENSGGGGAARTITVTNQSGTPINTSTDQAFQQNNDPGAASAGITCNIIIAEITATSGTVRITYSGSVVQAGVAEEWTGIDLTTPVVGTPVGANGVNSTNLASCADTSVANGNLAYAAMAVEGPSSDTYTQDADTTNGSWSDLTKAGTTNVTADQNSTIYGGYKVVNATGGQTYNPTINTARDSAGIIVEFAAAPVVVSGNQASETDTGTTGTVSVTVQGQQATETDEAFSGSAPCVVIGSLASETDTAESGTLAVALPGSLAEEVDTGFAGSVGSGGTWSIQVSWLGLVSSESATVEGSRADETDTATTGSVSVTVQGQRADETDTASSGSATVSTVGQRATETDTGIAGTVAETVFGAQASETDTGRSGTPTASTQGSQASETDTGNHGTVFEAQTVAGALASETDIGAHGDAAVAYSGTAANETDSGRTGNNNTVYFGDRAIDVEEAFAGIVAVSYAGDRAVETDTGALGEADFPDVSVLIAVVVESQVGDRLMVHGVQERTLITTLAADRSMDPQHDDRSMSYESQERPLAPVSHDALAITEDV